MGTSRYIVLAAIVSILFLSSPGVFAEEVKDQGHVDIDQYITIKIEFTDGDSLSLEADITASNDPISIFLIKGDEEFQRWVETEDAFIDGENTTAGNGTFQVIKDFSKRNTTEFTESISIGDKDTYYLVIVIYREEGMAKADLLSRGSVVDYDVTWKEETKVVPYYLIPVAILFALIGIGFVVYYIRSSKQDEEDEIPEERPERPQRRSPSPPHSEKRRAPPMR